MYMRNKFFYHVFFVVFVFSGEQICSSSSDCMHGQHPEGDQTGISEKGKYQKFLQGINNASSSSDS